ncbi:ferrochelatase [Austwickia chelonae]|uniref:Coproporphyrin III ferrochelatase n=1 Tax=Austwickia chelonae NBRC 105200 TaxID=1184607 RepID=K6ULW3_9MICO|nr:ferrochelatase [Austwickia chelonae]GAB77596.1 ferrochelatase [Austwickia chelonae NBRC 105200]SEW13727.1 ferrochelatase [Austwickia chelonae]
MSVDALSPYDAVLLHSFGGPETPEEVLPFLERVTGGRGIPRARLEEVGRHYFEFGGRSPINDENRALISALETELSRRGAPRSIFWGNRFAEPFTSEALGRAREFGVRRLVAVTTSAFPSYSGCRAYREDLDQALSSVTPDEGSGSIQVDRTRPYAMREGFIEANARLVATAFEELVAAEGLTASQIRLLFVTHSIPVTQNDSSGPAPGGAYLRWHEEVCAQVSRSVGRRIGERVDSELVFCSRSGPPNQAWLEPDVEDRIRELAVGPIRGVVVAPVGFTADHMEVVYDLDVVAATAAHESGLAFTRVSTVRREDEFVNCLVDLLFEQAARARGESTGPRGAAEALTEGEACCGAGCCPNPRGV